jgi:uncharacterized protein (TIGR03545 family)
MRLKANKEHKMKNDTAEKQKTGKAPGVFKKPIDKNKFEKKYAKYIEHPQDKNFIFSCFKLQDDKYLIRDDLSKDDVKKIKNLLKVIKTNKKGPVKIIPIVFAASITALVIIFFSVFANPLLEKAMEMGLEAAFEAKSDVKNLRISLIRFRISIAGITVANRDSPMTNLFQMGRTEIRLKPQAVLRGKIYIEEIRADSIRFGTARTVSGAIPAKPPKVKKEKPKNDAPPLVDLKNFDAIALLNQEFDKLNTPKLYDDAINAYNEASSKWQGQAEKTTARVQEVRTVTQPVMNLNVNSLRDADSIRKAIQDANNAINTVQAAAGDVTTIVNGLQADINTAQRLETNARNSLTSDINHLKSYIDLGSGAAFSAVEPFIRDMLSDTAEKYLDYGIMALEVLEKVKANSSNKPKEEKPKKERKIVFKGRNVHFPVVSYPSFYLGTLASDFTIDTWNWAFDLGNISSDPDITYKLNNSKPAVTLFLGLTEDGGSLQRNVSFNGRADFRTDTKERFSAEVTGNRFPLSLGDKLSQLGFDGLKGETAFSVNMNGQTDGGFSSGGNVIINQATLVNPNGTIAEAIDTAVRQAGNINLGLQYVHKTNEKDDFKITTNIADLFARALRSIAETYVKKAMDDIEKALRQKIDQYIDGRFASKEQVDMLLKTVKGDKTAMDQLKNSLDSKKNELEQKLKSQATDAAQQAGQSILNSVPKPSLPGLGR